MKTIAQKLQGVTVKPSKPKGPLTRVPRAGNSVPGQVLGAKRSRIRREFT